MYNRTDISQQIKKYLDGELDAHAMHELERRAQDDPFLMDALEGYEKVPVDQLAVLNELQGRLQQRVEKKEARIIPWRMLGIAASVLLLLGIGLFWYTERSSPPRVMEKVVIQKPSVNSPEIAESKPSAGGDSAMVAANTDKIITNHSNRVAVNRRRKEYSLLHVAADKAVTAVPPAVSDLRTGNADAVFKPGDTTPLNEMVVMEYTAKKKSNALLKELPIGSVADSASPLSYKKETAALMKIDTNKLKGNVVRIKGTDIASANNDLSGYSSSPALNQYKNTQVYFGNSKPQLNAAVVHSNLNIATNSVLKGYTAKRLWPGGNITPFNPVVLHGRMVKGMVKVSSGEPVSYATVKIKGTNISTLTDADGRFTLYTVPDSAILQVTADGDVLEETKVIRRDLQVISIHPENDNDLSEDIQSRPSVGWSDFYGYLHQNAVSPTGRKGTVKLSFKVNADNSLSDFKIIKGINPQTNNAAVKLVKDGPVWYSPSDDKAQTVTISIKFHVRKK